MTPGLSLSRHWRSAVLLGAVALGVLAAPTLALGATRKVVLESQSATLEVRAPDGASASAVVIVTSDLDGWRGLTRALGDQLAGDGYAVIGLDARSYLLEATRRSGSVAPATVPEDYLVVLRLAHTWFPEAQQTFLIGVSEGAGLSILAATDRRVGAQLTGVVGIETSGSVPLRSPYWAWTSWITHRDVDSALVPIADFVAAVAPTPLSFIDSTHRAGPPDVEALFAHGGEPRRLAFLETQRTQLDDVRDELFAVLHACLDWSTRVATKESRVSAEPRVVRSGSTR